ncbi:MAG: oligosaccharide flippase family protein [Ignavibacteriaceae bacterium]|nr:oligosaccharide flippase family protein [Ignavibacteriaceae bacterium]
MIENLKSFLKHSAVYSISNAAAKAMGVVLLPLYTKYISLSDFGLLALVEITIIVLVEFLTLGQGQAIVMFNDSVDFRDKKRSIFYTLTLLLASVSAVSLLFVGAAVYAYGEPIPYLDIDNALLYPALIVVFFRVLNNLLLDKVRAEEKSVLYTIANLSKLLISLLLVILFITYYSTGIIGVIYAYIIAEGLLCTGLILAMLKEYETRIEKGIVRTALQFGVPLIFTNLAFMLLNVSDRYILKALTDNESVALYDLGYRVAGIINMFIIMPFMLTLMPQAYKMYKQPGDKRYYSKLMTYFSFVVIWLGLALSLFSREIIKIFALNPDYWPAYQVVPVVTLAYTLMGIRLFAVLGQYLTRNTKSVAYTTLIAAAMNIALNIIYIPRYGLLTAAWTTLIAFALLLVMSYAISNRYYSIPYELWKLFLLLVLGISLYVATDYVYSGNFLIDAPVKLAVILIFPLLLYPFGFYEKVEIEKLRQIAFAKDKIGMIKKFLGR